jgi:hypothetical protein
MNGLPFLTDAELASPQVLDPVTITHVLPKKISHGHPDLSVVRIFETESGVI